jgi:hypothetical protein
MSSESALLQIGMADGEAFGPESKLLRRKEVVDFKEVFHAVREDFLKNLGGCDGSCYPLHEKSVIEVGV